MAVLIEAGYVTRFEISQERNLEVALSPKVTVIEIPQDNAA